jgi:hypothetical protein
MVMISHLSRVAACFGLLLLLGACAGNAGPYGLVYNRQLDAYSPSVLGYSAARGGINLELPNNPFPLPREDFERVIGQALYGAAPASPFAFYAASHRPEEFNSPYRVIVLLDAARGARSEIICKGAQQPVAGGGPEMGILMTLCVGDKLMSTVTGSIARPAGPEDYGLTRLLRHMVFLLMPREDPNQDDSRRWNWLD